MIEDRKKGKAISVYFFLGKIVARFVNVGMNFFIPTSSQSAFDAGVITGGLLGGYPHTRKHTFYLVFTSIGRGGR